VVSTNASWPIVFNLVIRIDLQRIEPPKILYQGNFSSLGNDLGEAAPFVSEDGDLLMTVGYYNKTVGPQMLILNVDSGRSTILDNFQPNCIPEVHNGYVYSQLDENGIVYRIPLSKLSLDAAEKIRVPIPSGGCNIYGNFTRSRMTASDTHLFQIYQFQNCTTYKDYSWVGRAPLDNLSAFESVEMTGCTFGADDYAGYQTSQVAIKDRLYAACDPTQAFERLTSLLVAFG
jgi:hypothetical protein